jgi:hypothetical protein
MISSSGCGGVPEPRCYERGHMSWCKQFVEKRGLPCGFRCVGKKGFCHEHALLRPFEEKNKGAEAHLAIQIPEVPPAAVTQDLGVPAEVQNHDDGLVQEGTEQHMLQDEGIEEEEFREEWDDEEGEQEEAEAEPVDYQVPKLAYVEKRTKTTHILKKEKKRARATEALDKAKDGLSKIFGKRKKRHMTTSK